MSGDVDFDWNEDFEPRVIRDGVLNQWGQVVFGESMPGPHAGLDCKIRISSGEIDVETGAWHFVIAARLVERVTYYRDLRFFGLQIHHRGAEGVPPLFVLGTLDRDLLARNLVELGYPVVDVSTGLYRSAPGVGDSGPV